MGKAKLLLLVLCLNFLFTNCTYAQKTFITDKTVAALQLRIDKIYNLIIEGIIRESKNYSQLDEAAKQRFKEGIQYYAMLGCKVDMNNPQSFANVIEDWQKNGFFIPNGPVQLSVNSDLSLDCRIPIKIKLDKFISFASEKNPKFKDSLIKVDDKNYTIKGLEGHIIKMNESGFYISPEKPLQTAEASKSWATMLKYIEDSDSNFSLEISVKDLHKSLYSASVERLTFLSVLKNALDDLSFIQRVRINFKKDKMIAIAAYSDEKKKAEHKEKLSQMLPMAIEGIKQQKLPNINIKPEDLDLKVEIVDKKQWLGIEGNGEATVAAAAGGLIGIAGMAMFTVQPTLANAQGDQAKQNACFSNLRVIQGATEMYCMDHEGDNKDLTIENLVKDGYLKSVPQCPANGKYDYKYDESKQYCTNCSLHGNPDNPSVYNAGNAQSAVPVPAGGNPVARQKACFSNIRVIQGAIEMYNMDNSDMMIDTMNKRQSSMALQHLVEEGYLSSIPKCPETGAASYYAIGDLTKDGEICCEAHGTINNPTPIK